MRVLLDECAHSGVSRALRGHEVRTVTEIGWRSSQDAPLLAFAERHFDGFVTIDRSLQQQNDLSCFNLGFVIVVVRSNRLECYEPLFDRIRAAAEAVEVGEVIVISGVPGST